jgi:hypothetical protein
VHDTQYDLEEEAMRRDGLAEELKNKNEGEVEVETKIEEPALGNYETPHQGIGSEATTTPTSAERVYGFWAGNGGVMTKKFGIDEETLVEEEKGWSWKSGITS